MNNDKYKILVISNICFSEEKNRTLCDLVKFINSNQVANFYLHGNPDKKICSNYFKEKILILNFYSWFC